MKNSVPFGTKQKSQTLSNKLLSRNVQENLKEDTSKIVENISGVKNLQPSNFKPKRGYKRRFEREVVDDEERKVKRRAQKRANKKRSREDVAKIYVCELCVHSTKMTRRELNAHYKTHGNVKGLMKYRDCSTKPDQLFPCEICFADFNSQDGLEKHFESHDNQYVCETCEKGFKKIVDYTFHVQVHSDDKLYSCPLCDLKTESGRKIKTHILTVHQKFKKYKCSFDGCGQGFVLYTHFLEHKNFHTGEKPYACDECEQRFMYSRQLAGHVWLRHELKKRLKCEICGQRYWNRSNFEAHLKAHGEPGVVCETCGKKIKNINNLRIHERTHTGYKPYKCSYCEKCFTTGSLLTQHERIHSGHRPYTCEHCGKGFTQKSSMVRHIRGHTGEKPYVCHICNKGYTSKSALTTHFKTCDGNIHCNE